MDDGVLDIRMVTADERFARLRLLWGVLTGTAGSSKVTHLREASRITVEALGAPLVLAVDGEPLPGVRSAEFGVRPGTCGCTRRASSPKVGIIHEDYPDPTLNHPWGRRFPERMWLALLIPSTTLGFSEREGTLP